MEWKEKFLEALGKKPIVSYACRMANVSRSTVYKARNRAEGNPEDDFDELWDEAVEQGLDMVEEELLDVGSGHKKGNIGAFIYYLKARRYEKRNDPAAPTKLILQWGGPGDE